MQIDICFANLSIALNQNFKEAKSLPGEACTAAKVIPKPNYVYRTAKVNPKQAEQIPTLKVRNLFRPVCK